MGRFVAGSHMVLVTRRRWWFRLAYWLGAALVVTRVLRNPDRFIRFMVRHGIIYEVRKQG